jgi:hypothetical protein
MKVSTEIDNNFGYEKITQLVDNIPLIYSFTIKSSPLALSFYKFLTQETISTLVISPFISLFRLFIRLLSISGRLISSSLFVSGALLIFLKSSKSESIDIFGCFFISSLS